MDPHTAFEEAGKRLADALRNGAPISEQERLRAEFEACKEAKDSATSVNLDLGEAESTREQFIVSGEQIRLQYQRYCSFQEPEPFLLLVTGSCDSSTGISWCPDCEEVIRVLSSTVAHDAWPGKELDRAGAVLHRLPPNHSRFGG